MYNFLKRVEEVKNSLSTSAFARELGMGQKTVDFYLRGERKPSVEFVVNICSKFGVSSDWLLGLSDDKERGGSAATATANGAPAIAVSGAGAKVTVGASGRHGVPTLPNCSTCKYKRLADAFKAIQTPD